MVQCHLRLDRLSQYEQNPTEEYLEHHPQGTRHRTARSTASEELDEVADDYFQSDAAEIARACVALLVPAADVEHLRDVSRTCRGRVADVPL